MPLNTVWTMPNSRMCCRGCVTRWMIYLTTLNYISQCGSGCTTSMRTGIFSGTGHRRMLVPRFIMLHSVGSSMWCISLDPTDSTASSPSKSLGLHSRPVQYQVPQSPLTMLHSITAFTHHFSDCVVSDLFGWLMYSCNDSCWLAHSCNVLSDDCEPPLQWLMIVI